MLSKEAKRKSLENSQYLNTNMPSIFNEHIIYSVTDLDGIITDVSAAFCTETGYSREYAIGKTHSFLRDPSFPNEVYEQLWDTITKDKTWKGQIKNIRKNSEAYWINTSVQPIFSDKNIKLGYIAIRQNITKEKRCEELSLIDELTGAYNRRKFNIEINNFLINYYRYDDNFSLLMMDIDHFKNFNDDYGHLVGDAVLKRVCNVIKNNIREGDLFARWGGEEFALVLNKVDKSKIDKTCIELLNKVRLDLPRFLLKNFGIETSLTCSIGLTSPERSDSVDTLIKRADAALYLAKENGRNRVEIL